MKKIIAVTTVLISLFFAACTKDGKINIGSIIYNAENEWFVEAIVGMQAAAKDLDVALSVIDVHYDATAEKESIREQLKSKADAIVICPLTVEETGAALADAATFHVPVVTWNTIVTPAPTTQIIVDSKKLGGATGDYLIEYIKNHTILSLKTALIIDESFSVGIERCDGFRDAIRPLVDNGVIQIVYEEQCQMYEETKVTIKKLLEERPDIQFIWCWHQMSLVGTIDTLKELGRSDILIAGTDMSVGLAKEMLNNDVQLIAVTTQQPYQMGYDAVVNAVKAVTNEQTDATIVIPTLTYIKDEPTMIHEYIETHTQFEKN